VVLGEDWHNYSVPFQYIGKKVKILYDSTNVEIYLNMQRIALHKRNYEKNAYSTQQAHCPPNHQIAYQIQQYTPQYFLQQAALVGVSTHKLVEHIITGNFFSEQNFKSCLGILRLEQTVGRERLERACQITLGGTAYNYRTVKNILDNNRDIAPDTDEQLSQTNITHNNIRYSTQCCAPLDGHF